MKLAYQYQLRPTPELTARFDSWLSFLWQYNYRLAKRFNWWQRNRFKTANHLLLKNEVIAIEDLNIKGLAKSKLSYRGHSCFDCQLTIDRDVNAAININKYRAVGHSVLKAHGV